ncbi:MAG: hypothetical protein GC178_15080 [Flavobacteriales bacterium]|nr:hypothetical protein [Flavobacteriales bacterium]
MRTWTLIVLISILSACSAPTDNGQNEMSTEQANHFDNVSKVEVFGDSLRIEYEIYDNTIIQHRIDLKGTKDDGFDNSYTVTSIWSSREASAIDCKSELQIVWDSLDFRFCVEQVIRRYDSLITEAGPWRGEASDSLNVFNQKIIELQEIKSQLEKIKSKRIGRLNSMPFYMPFDLLRTIEFSVTDLRTDDQLNRVLVEDYETEFSGGKNFYLVNSTNDTIGKVHKNEYMR